MAKETMYLEVEATVGALGGYHENLSKLPLLTAEEEAEHAKAIEAGLFAQNVLDGNVTYGQQLTETLQAELEEIARQGRQSKNRMIEGNMRLVTAMANKYAGRGLPVEDLIQEGSLGLIRAVEKFDYQKGFKFSTYADDWIWHAIDAALSNQSRTIRVPEYQGQNISAVRKTQQELQHSLGRDPTMQEIAEAKGMDTARVIQLLAWDRNPLSIFTPIRDDGTELIERIEERDIPGVDTVATTAVLRRHVRGILRNMLESGELSESEAEVVTLRYGLRDGREYSRPEIAAIQGRSPRTIQSRFTEAKKRLQASKALARLYADMYS